MFSKIFIGVKCATVFISLVTLLINPRTIPYLIAVNALITAPESIWTHRQVATGLLAIAISAWALTLQWNDTRLERVVPFLMVYALWNAVFYYQLCRQWIGAISQVAVAVLPALVVLFYGKEQKEWALWVFSLVRACVLAVMCLYAVGKQVCL